MSNSVAGKATLNKIAARLGRQPLSAIESLHRFDALKADVEPPVFPDMSGTPKDFFCTQAEKNLFEISRFATLQSAISSLQTSLPLILSPQENIQRPQWRENGHRIANTPISPGLGIVEASHGIAETGTVVVSSKDAPSALLFLSEELLIVLDTEKVVSVQDDLWESISRQPQRALHLISGPSRTADVEQTLQVGAHGPRRVYLWLIGRTDIPA